MAEIEKKRTKPPHEPTEKTRAEVSALKSYGVPLEEIADYIGIDRKTLSKHYKSEIAEAQLKANANVANFLYGAASGAALKKGAKYSDCVRAAMFWTKTRMGWRESGEVASEEPKQGVVIEVVRATGTN
jgi:hypothetical protein